MIDERTYTELAGLLTSAELRDYVGVEVLGYGVREWAGMIGIAHQNISPRLRSAREKLEHEQETDEPIS